MNNGSKISEKSNAGVSGSEAMKISKFLKAYFKMIKECFNMVKKYFYVIKNGSGRKNRPLFMFFACIFGHKILK